MKIKIKLQSPKSRLPTAKGSIKMAAKKTNAKRDPVGRKQKHKKGRETP